MANAAAPAGSSNIAFRADDGTILRGWHFLPKNGGADRAPLIVLHHGFSGVKEFYLDKFSNVFAEAGLGVLVYDPRGLGDSEGRIRQEIDPFQQVSDFRDAISFGSTLPRVDPDRIGVWGCSYGGGVAIQATALDQRIGCIVVQVPFLSGGGYWSQVPPEARKQLSQIFAQDRRARAAGQLPMMVAVAAEDATKTLCVLPTQDSWEFCMRQMAPIAPNWKNEVTLRSFEMIGSFEPLAYLHRITPRPLMFIGAENDSLIPFELAKQAFERVGEPKQLLALPSGHFDCYGADFEQSASAARDWYVKHLVAK
jgi:fermentation-respiration switch protein FrsA (DUF1100 family)